MSTNESEYVFVGMGGWELPSFYGTFYPAKPLHGFRKLEFYSAFFDVVEVNATFYTTSISPAQTTRWIKEVSGNPKFLFAVKLFRGFTHSFDATQQDLLAIQRMIEPLKKSDKLVGIVVQFPTSFTRTKENLEHLAKLRSLFPNEHLILEMRHRSWDSDEFYSFCNEKNLIVANNDLPAIEPHIPFQTKVWNGIAYFRMMGRNAKAWNDFKSGERYAYCYSDAELQELANNIINIAPKTKRAYVIFHNDTHVDSLANGMKLKHLLDPQKKLFAPPTLLAKFPHLQSICEPMQEENLFSSLKDK